MDSSSVHEAAERLRRYSDGEDCEAIWGEAWNLRQMRDQTLLFDAMLAETDPTEITPEGLESVGFSRQFGGLFSIYGELNFDYSINTKCFSCFRRDGKRDLNYCGVNTMGELRTLLRLSRLTKGGGE